MTKDEQLLIFAEEKDIYIQDNPLTVKEFKIYGGEDVYPFLNYATKIIEGDPMPHDPEMDKYLIAPVLMNMTHFYSYFNMQDHLKKALDSGASFFSSKRKVSPLSLSLAKDYSDTTKVILNWVKKNLETNIYAAICIENSLISMNFKGYPGLDKLYTAFWTQARDITLPKFCPKNLVLPLTIQSKTLEPIASNFFKMSELPEEGKSIKYFISAISINIISGSQESIDFMRSLYKTPNEEIFRTKFIRLLLSYKWNRLRWIKIVESLIYSIYLAYLTIYTIIWPGDGIVLIPCFIINKLLMLYEFYQMIQGGILYWENPWNMVDMIRFAIFNIYAFFLWFEVWLVGSSYLLVLLTLISYIRGISYFRIFSNTRYLINLIQEVSKDIVSFLVLLLYSVLAFGVIFYTIQDDPTLRIADYLTLSYSIALNDFESKNWSDLD